MAKVNLKDPTKDLLEDYSRILEKATAIKIDASDMLRELNGKLVDVIPPTCPECGMELGEFDKKDGIGFCKKHRWVSPKGFGIAEKERERNGLSPLCKNHTGAVDILQTEELNQSAGKVYTEEIVDYSRKSDKTSEKTQALQADEEPIRPYKGEKSYLFISYSHRDTELVYPIIRHMQGLGLRVWFDEGIVPGKEWDDYVAERVLECDAMIAFISPNYLKSSNCRDELNYARDKEKDRLLIYLENVKLTPGMAMRMNRIQAIHQYTYSKQSLFYEKLMECSFVARNRSFDGE